MSLALLVGESVGFDWNLVYELHALVYYVAAFVAGFIIKFSRESLRTPQAAGTLAGVYGATSFSLGLCDIVILPVLAVCWVAVSLLPEDAGMVQRWSLLALAPMCSVAALIRSLIERTIIRSILGKHAVNAGMSFLFFSNFGALAVALTALYWYTIWTSPNGGKGV